MNKKSIGLIFCFVLIILVSCSAHEKNEMEVITGRGVQQQEAVKVENETGIKQEISPYLQNVNKTSITIMWETDNALSSRVDYGLTDSYGSHAINPEKVTIHEITISGLATETTYHYKVSSGSASSADNTFQTAVATNAPFRFVAYGDTRTHQDNHSAVIKSIIASEPKIVLHTGDIVTDGRVYEQWETEFFRPTSNLTKNTPMFLALGNHEGNSSWYYDFFSNPKTSTTEAWYSFDYGNSHFIILDSNQNFNPGSVQYSWLVNDLDSAAAQSAEWLFAIFHHPVYTSGSHGDSIDVQNYLAPLFETYGIDIVFNGHDHFYEKSYKKGTYYIVTGGGGAPLYDTNMLPNPYRQYTERTHHHCTIDINGGSLLFNARYNNGTVFDSFSLPGMNQ